MKHLIFILLLLALATAVFAVTATWTSITDRSWQNPVNWNPHGVPISSTDVIIPGTYPLSSPLIYAANAYCNNITIESNNFLEVTSGYSLTVNGTMTMNGDLSMSGTGGVSISGDFKCYGQLSVSGTGALTVSGNAYWYSGSSIVDDSDTQLKLFKDMYIYAGAGFIMNNGGKVSFFGSGPSDICNYEDTTQFGNLIAAKSTLTGYLNIRYDTTEPFKIKNNLENNSGSIFYCSKDLTFTVLGNVTDWNSGDTAGAYGIKWNAGTLKMDGASQNLDMQGPGCYLNHLLCSATVGVVNEYDLIIKGNLTIERGYLSADGFTTITIAGNWDNQVGASGFWENSGRVIFNNSTTWQIIYSNETFNILEVDNAPKALRFTSGKTVTCAKYDWTSGGIDMNTNATFTATDLADPGIYGGWWLTNTSGVINITNENVDLKGSITITSGTFNVNSAALYSLWNSYDNVKLTMSGGALDFHNTGIQIYNIYGSPLPTFMTLTLTGGTIKTAKDFEGTWAGFSPTGGIFEFYGSSASTLDVTQGNFYNLKINKTGGAAAILAGNNFTLGGNLTVSSGILNAMTYQISCVHAYITGTLKLNTKLNCSGDISWHNGSLATVADNSIIECGGNWYAGATSNVLLNSTVKVYFTSTAARNITISSANHSLGNWRLGEDSSGAIYTGGVYSVAAASTQNLTVPGSMYIRVGNTLDLNERSMTVSSTFILWGTLIIDSGTVTVNGVTTVTSAGVINIGTGTLYLPNQTFLIPAGAEVTLASGTIKCDGFSIYGTFQPAGGTVILYSTNSTSKIISLGTGNWMPNLTVDALFKTYHLASNITIKGSFTIDYGQFSVQHPSSGMVYDMFVAENWWNNQGPSHFIESSGRVVFNGTGTQEIKTTEVFNIIESNNSGGNIQVNSPSAVVACASYDWTAGGVEVLAGAFTINDLVDNAMYGGFYCANTGILNIHQDPDHSIDLYGAIQVTGGTMNIYGGIRDASWARYSPSTVKISEGSLHYHDRGVNIRITYPLTYDISGGTVSTTGDLYCNRTDFNPTGGAFEMRGNTDTTLEFTGTGSSLFNLTINKEYLDNMVGQASGLQTIRGELFINRGTYHIQNRTLICFLWLTVHEDGKLYCQDSNTVKIGSGGSILVHYGGHIYVSGYDSAERTTFTHNDGGYYNFNVLAGGKLSANNVVFEYTGTNGVYIQPDAIVDFLHNCRFQNGSPGGTLLRMDNNQNLNITHADFPTNAGGTSKNVAKTVNSGSVYFSDWTGVFGGPSFEVDDYNRISWQGVGVPPIIDLAISYISATNSIHLTWYYQLFDTTFNIYRSTDPEGPFDIIHATSEFAAWSEVVPGPFYFYRVSAVTP